MLSLATHTQFVDSRSSPPDRQAPGSGAGGRAILGDSMEGRAAIPLRLELLELVDDPIAALILQQLCYWTSRKPGGWIVRTYDQISEALGSNRKGKAAVSARTVRRKLEQLEDLKLLTTDIDANKRGQWKRYQVDREIAAIDYAIEASRGPSSIVAASRNGPSGQSGQPPLANLATPPGQIGQPPLANLARHLEIEKKESLLRTSRAREADSESGSDLITLDLRVADDQIAHPGFSATQGRKLLNASGGDIELAAECYIDKRAAYPRAPMYRVLAWTEDEIAKRLEERNNPATRRNGSGHQPALRTAASVQASQDWARKHATNSAGELLFPENDDG